ncbi:MAG: hypothetical protein ABIK12_12110 [Pseudomonadota bacterium]
MDKPQTPPPGVPVIDLTDMVEPEEQALRPAPKPAQSKDLGELDRILAELSAQSPPPAREDDLDKLMAEMGLPPQPRAQAPSPDESELQDILQELGGKEQAGAEGGQEQGTGDPELDDLLSMLGSQGRPQEKQAAKKTPKASASESEPAPVSDPEDLVDLVRMAVRQILEDEAPEMVSRLVARELEERLEEMVTQELEKQLKARVTQEVKDLLRKAMSKAGRPSGKRDDGVVVD